jgi:bloom syndrome protein
MTDTTDLVVEANMRLFGNEGFRPMQQEIINSVMKGEDALVVMPTGGGKSLLYQLPSVLTKGVTVVVSPLLSLIEDQVSSLISLGIPSAYLSSTSTLPMIRQVFEDLRRTHDGNEPFLKLLYITPERLIKSDVFRAVLSELYNNEFLARFVVDECHCISSWGHDFRKEYKQLGILRSNWKETPILAVTATARNKVIIDVRKTLCINSSQTYNAGFDRPNIFFEVRAKHEKDPNKQLINLLKELAGIYGADSSGIIYTMTRQQSQDLADVLKANGVSADYYHAGQAIGERKAVQTSWLQGRTKVVCATIAYGMGIDKRDVRFVIHFVLSKSIEGFYQEAGRAGRDGKKSHSIILYSNKDCTALARLMAMKKKALSKKDRDALEEITEYCKSGEDCRRKHLSTIFLEKEKSGSSVYRPTNCRMCDICTQD